MEKGQRLDRGVMRSWFGRFVPWLAIGLVACLVGLTMTSKRAEDGSSALTTTESAQEMIQQVNAQFGDDLLAEEVAQGPTWLAGNMSGNQSFFNKLLALGISGSEVHRLVQLLKPVYNFRRSHPGHTWQLGMIEGTLVQFILEVSPVEIYEIMDFQTEPRLSQRSVDVITRWEVHRGVIQGSLFQSLSHVRESTKLSMKLAEVFAWDIDFSKDPRIGDQVEVLAESKYIRREDGATFHEYGDILAARYSSRSAAYEAYRFEAAPGEFEYYDAEGKSLVRDVLRSPLKLQRVTSRFNKNRYHPILKRRRPHNGVDYGAKPGTPVRAVANGSVIRSGWLGQAGKAVELTHRNQMVTQYFHLSRIAKGVSKGQRVRQGQVIGYVGKTGAATGYHLHFGMKIKGRFVDPLKQKFQPGRPLKKDQMKAFKKNMLELGDYLRPPGIPFDENLTAQKLGGDWSPKGPEVNLR